MDELVDRALAKYVPAEAPVGMERRILAHARAPRRSMTPWVAAAAVICTVCAVIALRPLFSVRPKIPVNVPPMVLPVRSAAPAIQAQSPPHRVIARRKARRPVLPKLRVFPQIEPVPEPEVALARLALNPEVGKALLAQPEVTEPEPIRIEPLSIKLLDED
jgi:hypothetical protein